MKKVVHWPCHSPFLQTLSSTTRYNHGCNSFAHALRRCRQLCDQNWRKGQWSLKTQQLSLLWWRTRWWRVTLFQADAYPYTYSAWWATLWKYVFLTAKPTFQLSSLDHLIDLRGTMNWRQGWNWASATCHAANVLHVVPKNSPQRTNWGCGAPWLPGAPPTTARVPMAWLEQGASQQSTTGHSSSPFTGMHTGHNGLSKGHFRHLLALEVLLNAFTNLRKLWIFPLPLFSSHPGKRPKERCCGLDGSLETLWGKNRRATGPFVCHLPLALVPKSHLVLNCQNPQFVC